jgi:hypothetical protein
VSSLQAVLVPVHADKPDGVGVQPLGCLGLSWYPERVDCFAIGKLKLEKSEALSQHTHAGVKRQHQLIQVLQWIHTDQPAAVGRDMHPRLRSPAPQLRE